MNCFDAPKGLRLRVFCTIIFLMLFVWILPTYAAYGETITLVDDDCFLLVNEYTGYEELIPIHTVTTVGRENVKINGVISKNTLLEYTIPDELLLNDPYFAMLMMEATSIFEDMSSLSL